MSTKVTPPTKTPFLARQRLTKCQKVAQRIIWLKLPRILPTLLALNSTFEQQTADWKVKLEKGGQLKSAELSLAVQDMERKEAGYTF